MGPHQGRFSGSGQGGHFRVVPAQGGYLVCSPLSHQALMCVTLDDCSYSPPQQPTSHHVSRTGAPKAMNSLKA